MLIDVKSTGARMPIRSQDQRGVVIVLALIMLVALTLGGLALFRAVDIGAFVSGNIAFQRSAMHSADAGTEDAIAWLNAQTETTLYGTGAPNYYYPAALADVPASTSTWKDYIATRNTHVLGVDATGNTVSYFIQRLCSASGQPFSEIAGGSGGSVNCVRPPNSSNVGSSKSTDFIARKRTSSVYYRVTVLSYDSSKTRAKSIIQTTVIK